MKFDLKSLEDFLQKPLPEIPEEVWTFLDISGYPHYENVISNIYAYYLNKDNSHGFEDLFLNALFNAIRKKAGDSFQSKLGYLDNWNEWEVSREEPVEGKRIDILLKETSGDKETFIIIENKVFAELDNPLDTYWSVSKSRRKLGVVLSLFEKKPRHNGYINITHSEYIKEIKNLQGHYLESSKERDLMILKDLIISLKFHAMEESKQPELLKFYAENRERIKGVINLRDTVKNDFLNKVVEIGETLDFDIKFKTAKDYREFRDKKKPDLALQFWFNEKDDSSHFRITLIAYDSLKAKGERLMSESTSIQKKQLVKATKYKKIELVENGIARNWIAIATKTYNLDILDFDLDQLKIIYSDEWQSVLSEFKNGISTRKK
jgi:hypothetical protein